MINSQTILRTGDKINYLNKIMVIHLVLEHSGQSTFEGRAKQCSSVVAYDGEQIKEIALDKISLIKKGGTVEN